VKSTSRRGGKVIGKKDGDATVENRIHEMNIDTNIEIHKEKIAKRGVGPRRKKAGGKNAAADNRHLGKNRD
jgi:hypothetical protein